jgi:hypothetical protein
MSERATMAFVELIDGGDEALVRVSYDDLHLMRAGLGEALQAVEDWEFQTRTGFERDHARALMDRIAEVLLAAGHWHVIP